MGSLLSLVVTKLFMEDFETKALAYTSLKPNLRKRFVDDNLINWHHGHHKLDSFLLHLNN